MMLSFIFLYIDAAFADNGTVIFWLLMIIIPMSIVLSLGAMIVGDIVDKLVNKFTKFEPILVTFCVIGIISFFIWVWCNG